MCRRPESVRFSLKVELDCVEMQGRRASESGFLVLSRGIIQGDGHPDSGPDHCRTRVGVILS